MISILQFFDRTLRRFFMPFSMVCLCYGTLEAQPVATKNSAGTIVFYNLENFFDWHDDADKKDEDFLPESGRRWNAYRYQQKLQRIQKVLANIGGWELPLLMGFCEFEHRQMLEDLAKSPLLWQGNYGIAHFESVDRRGIDTGILYQRGFFKLLDQCAHAVVFDDGRQGREILEVQGILPSGDTLHVLVNHWSSRWSGEMATVGKRKVYAERVSEIYKNIRQQSPGHLFLSMGDFNDEPSDASLQLLVQQTEGALHCLMDEAEEPTHYFRSAVEAWSCFDQFWINRECWQHSGWQLSAGKAFRPSWLLNDDGTPFRTFRGFAYEGGFSDHLPIYLRISPSPIVKAPH